MAKNYQVENIGVNIVSTVEQSLQALSQLKAKIAETNAQLKDTNTKVSQIKLNVSASGKLSTSTVIKDMSKDTKTLSDNANKATSNFGKMGGALARIFTLRFAIMQFSRAFKEMSDFAENYNLFTVAMKDYKNEAISFHNEMNRAWGTNISQTMRYQGFFQNLVTSLGIAEDKAFAVSQSLTTLTLDMASLFNWNFDVAYQRLQAGIVGQTKPLRYAGIDVTQQTIQPILGELGIDKQVVQLTQAEKVMLRYIAILRQSSNAHGDFARTLESPANQMRIMQTTVQELYRWFGGLFIGLIGSALPYINGFLMAIKEVIKALAIMFGFNQDDYDFYNSGGENPFQEEIEDPANSANEAVKKLQGSLRKFDEINNINMSRGGVGGVGGVGTTDSKLWEELQRQMEKYKSGLGDIQSKASGIRDTILRWLGITVDVNDETQELELTLSGWTYAILTFIGILAGAKMISAIAGLFTAFGTISTALGVGGTAGAVGTGLIGGVGLLHLGLIALGGALVIGAIINLRDRFAEVEKKVKKGEPLTTVEDIMWGIKEETNKAVTAFKNLNEEFFGDDDGNKYTGSKFEVFLNNLNFHLQHTLGWFREMQLGFRNWAKEVDSKNVPKFSDTLTGKFLLGLLNMLKDIIKYFDTLGVGVLEWLGFDMTGYKGGKAPPPTYTPPPNLTPPSLNPKEFSSPTPIKLPTNTTNNPPTTINVVMADGTKFGTAIIDLVNETQSTTGKTVNAY